MCILFEDGGPTLFVFDLPYSNVPSSGHSEQNILKPAITWSLSFVLN